MQKNNKNSEFSRRRRFPLARGATLALMLIAGPAWALADSVASGKQQVTIQLRWHTQFQFAGYYAALAKGYYRDAGYDVRLVEGAPGKSPVREVLAGRAQYGTGNSGLLYWRLHGKPLVALAVIGQHSPSVLIARQDSGIRSPQDMIGKRVMMVRDRAASEDADFIAMLRNEGISPSQLTILNSSYDIEDLITGKTDLFNAYLTNEPYYLQKRGIAVNIINPLTYGIDFYSDALFTTEQELEDHPERVAAIRGATLRGWRYAMDHPEEIIDLLLNRFGAAKSRDHLRYEAQSLRELILPELIEIGHMNPGRWKHMADTLVQLGLADPDYSLDGFVYTERTEADFGWFWWMVELLGVVALLAAVIALTLFLFNRRLRREVKERREAESRLRESERDLRAIVHNIQDVFYRADERGQLIMVSPSSRAVTGYEPEELIGRTLSSLYANPAERRDFLDALERAGGSILGHEVVLQHRDGSLRWFSINAQYYRDEEGNIIGLEGTARDITERKRNEAVIEHQAYYDTLTDLPNRRTLLERLENELFRSARHGHNGALLFLDLDNFKTINDSLGHAIGDRFLCEVAMRLKQMVRNEDTAARLGGDEFVVLMPQLSADASEAGIIAREIAERIRLRLAEGYGLDGRRLFSSASIGITIFSDAEQTPEEILKQADIAMYRAKAHGKNRLEFYLPSMQEAATERLSLENCLREAVEQQRFELHYQPQVDSSGAILAAEALLRWRHPEQGVMAPGRFIPVAEESGLILKIGAWVLDEASRQLRAWMDAGILPPDFRLAINVSARQFHQHCFVQEVERTLHRHGIPGSALAVELTEGTLLNDVDDAVEKMRALKRLGVRLSIDDFGTGYSSLSYLKRLPVDTLKIDRTFVQDIAVNRDDGTLVETILFMARQLKMEAVAEGVESAAAFEALAARGCNLYQGYYVGEPLPPEAFASALADSRKNTEALLP